MQSSVRTLLLVDTIICFFIFYSQETDITILFAKREQPMLLVGLNKINIDRKRQL